MSRKYKVGSVIAVIVGICSFLLLIWTVLVWIMASTRNSNFLVNGYGIALFVILGDSFWELAELGEATGHLWFAGITLFFSLGTWVNIHGAYRLSSGGNRDAGLSVFFGIINCFGSATWVSFLVMSLISISKWGMYSGLFTGVAIGVIVVSLLAFVGTVLTGVFLFTQIRERKLYQGAPAYFDASPMSPTPYQEQPFNQQPEPQPFNNLQQPGIAQPFNNLQQPNNLQPPNIAQPLKPMQGFNQTQKFELDAPRRESLQPYKKQMGCVRVTEGQVLGKKGYQIPDGYKIVVGKDSHNASLVIDNPHISNVHCSICYDAKEGMYIVRDHSTNGTEVYGNRLVKDVPTRYPAGTILSLAKGQAEIKLG